MEYYNYGSIYGYDTSMNTASSFSAGLIIFGLILIAFGVLFIVSMWKVFKKVGKPGWAAIVPYYNYYVMCQIAEKPWWYLLLFFVPFVSIYAMFVLYDGISKKFGKSTGFTIGLMLVPFVFWPLLAFGKNEAIGYVSEDVQPQNMNMTNETIVNGQTNSSVDTTNVNSFEQVNTSSIQMPSANETVTPSFNDINTTNNPVNNINEVPNQAFNNISNDFATNVNSFEQVNTSSVQMPSANETVAPPFNEFNTVNNSVNNINEVPNQTFNNLSNNFEANLNANNFAEQMNDVSNVQMPNETNITNVNENTTLWSNQNNNPNSGQM